MRETGLTLGAWAPGVEVEGAEAGASAAAAAIAADDEMEAPRPRAESEARAAPDAAVRALKARAAWEESMERRVTEKSGARRG